MNRREALLMFAGAAVTEVFPLATALGAYGDDEVWITVEIGTSWPTATKEWSFCNGRMECTE